MKESDVSTYNRVALEVNAPIYTFYAEKILEKTGIAKGRCLDIGCGGGYLGLALAEMTDLEFVFIDKSPAMLRCAEENIHSQGLVGRGRAILGEVQEIPLENASVDLVVSRGSVPFWDDLPAAFGEIRRILKPGGHAYIGGGLGPPAIREALKRDASKKYPEWFSKTRQPPRHESRHYREALQAAGVEMFTITRSDIGMWIEFRVD